MKRQSALEKSIVAGILRRLRSEPGVVVRKRHGTAMGVAGDPDLYGSIKGRHFEIEVKRPGAAAVLTELQRRRLREWERAGAIVGLARSAEDALTILADPPDLETAETQRRKIPARGARKPNADEQAGDWGDE